MSIGINFFSKNSSLSNSIRWGSIGFHFWFTAVSFPLLKNKENTTDLGYSVYRDYSGWFEKRESKLSVQNLPQLQTTKIKKGRRANAYMNISVCDNVKLLQGNCRLHSITSLFSKYRQTLPKCHSLSSFQTKHTTCGTKLN